MGVSTRATAISGAPTASRLSLVSTPDRHLVFMGTENTIGTTGSQDDLLIRFSDQEDITTYQPTAENTAGSFVLLTDHESWPQSAQEVKY